MTTIDDYSDFIGYDVVAQRRKSSDENNSSYCPGVIKGISEKNKFIVKFGDNEKSEISPAYLNINDPDDISESNKYWLNLASIYAQNTSVLADIEYNSDNINYQYGRIDSYDYSSNTCTVIFNKFGKINNIPTSSIITPCDNRYITGVGSSSLSQRQEEESSENVEAERDCQPIENIDNLPSNTATSETTDASEFEETKSEVVKKKNSYLKYLLILNIITLVMTATILYFNFNYFYRFYFKISRFSFINYIIMFCWWPLISFSLGPLYLIYWIVVQTLDLFSFKVSFNLSSYLGGKCPFHCKMYILVLILITIGYLYLQMKNLKSVSTNLNPTNQLDSINSDSVTNSTKLSTPNIRSLGNTLNPEKQMSTEYKIPSL